MNSANDYLHDARVFAPPRPCAAAGLPEPAQFYTSSPRPFAKTSLGFYSDQQPAYDNVSDGEDDEMESGSGSGSSSATSSGASSPASFDNANTGQQDADAQPMVQQNNNGMMYQQQPAIPLPSFHQQFQHITFIQPQPLPPLQPQRQNGGNNPLTNIPLDQHTLQQLMINPELLRQLNDASSRLMATKVAAANGHMPPPMPPTFFQPPIRSNFNMPGNQAMPPPGFFPFPCAFPTPNQTPNPSPVCGASVRPPTAPVITGVFSNQPLQLQRPPCNWQQTENGSAGLLKIASPPRANNRMQPPQPSQCNGKICLICGEDRAGLHYGVISCFACMDFFRRRVMNAVNRRSERRCFNDCYNKTRNCLITKETRNHCKFCRFQKCLDVGMKIELVKPNSTVDSRRCQSALPPMI